jgi:hypothetical protein
LPTVLRRVAYKHGTVERRVAYALTPTCLRACAELPSQVHLKPLFRKGNLRLHITLHITLQIQESESFSESHKRGNLYSTINQESPDRCLRPAEPPGSDCLERLPPTSNGRPIVEIALAAFRAAARDSQAEEIRSRRSLRLWNTRLSNTARQRFEAAIETAS